MAKYEWFDNNSGETYLDHVWNCLRGQEIISLDLETTGLDPHTDKILLYGFKGEGGCSFVTGDKVAAEQMLAATRNAVWLAHNAAFEYMFLTTHGHTISRKWFDTMLAEQLLTAGLLDARHDLEHVIRKYCGNVHMGKALQTSFVGANPATFKATDEQLRYLADDVAYLHDVMHVQLKKLESEGLLRVCRLEMQALPAFAEMQLNGFYLNRERHAPIVAAYVQQEAEARRALEEALEPLWKAHIAQENRERALEYAAHRQRLDAIMAEAGIARLSKETNDTVRGLVAQARKARDKCKPKKVEPINVGSSEQVLAAMAVAGVRPVMAEPNGKEKASLDKNVLREMQDVPLVRLYSAWAKPAKAVSTYGEKMWERISPVTGRFHAGYRQCGAASGRTSTSPQIQNIPPDVRACFEAQEGNVLIVADAKNQEGRLAAVLSGDENLLAVFREGIDWHSLTAAAAWPSRFPDWHSVPKDSPERARAKNGNFSSIYGGTGYTLFSRGYVDDVETGDSIMRAIAETYPVLADFSQKQANLALARGHVDTISGRKRYFRLAPQPTGKGDALLEWKRQRGGIRRAAMNHPVQGSGADVMKLAMAFLLQPMKELGYKAVAMVHDELVYEGPQGWAEEARQLVLHWMEYAAACFTNLLPIPADAHATKEWKK